MAIAAVQILFLIVLFIIPMFLKVFIYIVHIIGKRLHRLPRKSDAYGQEEVERMFCAVGLDVALRRDIIL